jgi:hypothetical protein
MGLLDHQEINMKRSELVDLITIEFNLADGMADEILALIESRGMMPPLIEKMENGRFVGSSSALYPEWENE